MDSVAGLCVPQDYTLLQPPGWELWEKLLTGLLQFSVLRCLDTADRAPNPGEGLSPKPQDLPWPLGMKLSPLMLRPLLQDTDQGEMTLAASLIPTSTTNKLPHKYTHIQDDIHVHTNAHKLMQAKHSCSTDAPCTIILTYMCDYEHMCNHANACKCTHVLR